MRTAAIIACIAMCAGCGMLEKVKDKIKPGPQEEWQMGSRTIDGGDVHNWRFALRVRNQDMSRPNGKPERITIAFDFAGVDYKVYTMIDNRDGIRHRMKGEVESHVSSFIRAPIPKQPSKWEWECVAGVLMFSIDGHPCRKYPITIGERELQRIIISPDPSRPAGCEWIAGEVEEL